LPRRRGFLNPPLSSTIVPRGTFFSSIQIAASWYRIASRRFVESTLGRLVRTRDVGRETRQIAKRVHYPTARIRFDTVFRPELGLPELITCAQEFDFPRCPPVPYYHYIGPSVDMNRDRGNSFPWDRLNQDKPLIFCAFGSESSGNRYYRRLSQTLIDAFAGRPDWQLILAIDKNKNMDAYEFNGATSNIILVDWAPQLEVLKRASLMVNHGGMGTVKECILSGVPMIAFPTMSDQPGNAARIVYHKLGMKGDIRKVTAEQIQSMIETMLGDSSYRERTEAMGQKFRESNTSERGVELVENLLASRDQIYSVKVQV
jgi:zeaxanthin glucosyltransferase